MFLFHFLKAHKSALSFVGFTREHSTVKVDIVSKVVVLRALLNVLVLNFFRHIHVKVAMLIIKESNSINLRIEIVNFFGKPVNLFAFSSCFIIPSDLYRRRIVRHDSLALFV